MEEVEDEGWEDMTFIYSNPPIPSPTEATAGDGAMAEDHLHRWDIDLNMEAEVEDDESDHGAMDCGDFDLNMVAELDDEDSALSLPQQARQWYDDYAHSEGFATRVDYRKPPKRMRNPTEKKMYGAYCCTRAGFRKNGAAKPKMTLGVGKSDKAVKDPPAKTKCIRKKPETRIGCKARIRFQLNETLDLYYISAWVGEHIHVMNPKEFAHLLVSNRRVTPANGMLMEINAAAGISLRSSFEIISATTGGVENVGCTKVDHRNHLARIRQRQMIRKIVKLREKWSSAWVKNHYTAGMVSTQLVESCNATVRGFLNHGMSLIDFFPHFERMLRSRRAAEKSEEFKARNTQPYVAFEYSDVVKKAAPVYTPKIFAMFQEQFARIQEYELRPGKSIAEPNSLSYVVFKTYRGDRVDDRVVTVNTATGYVNCVCKWWDTIGLLCRHCLKVMVVLGSFGHHVFQSLNDRYVVKRWTRVAKVGYASNVATLLRSKGEEDEERYIHLYAKFGRIVRAVYSEEGLYKYIDIMADNIIDRVDLGIDALAALFGQEMVLTVPPDNNLLLCAGGDSNGGRGMALPSDTPADPKDIAVKFPKQPKPRKNTLRYKTDSEIYRRRASKKWKQSDARLAAAATTATTVAAQESVAHLFPGIDPPFSIHNIPSSQRSIVVD
ncbi:Protein FAR1-RELATED SEQUENCE 5 [Linum grandiflorum]